MPQYIDIGNKKNQYIDIKEVFSLNRCIYNRLVDQPVSIGQQGRIIPSPTLIPQPCDAGFQRHKRVQCANPLLLQRGNKRVEKSTTFLIEKSMDMAI